MPPLSPLVAACVAATLAWQPTPQKRFDRYVTAYRAYGLPTPPADAPLVRFLADPGWIEDGKVMRPVRYELGFLVRPARADKPAVVFTRFGECQLSPSGPSVQPVVPKSAAVPPGTQYADPVFAAQCALRGWNELARAAWGKVIRRAGADAGEDGDDSTDPQLTLAADAWRYWEGVRQSPQGDRAAVLKHWKLLLATHPDQFGGLERELVRCLELALVPSTAKPGSIEAMIDDLVEATETPGVGHVGEERYTRLAARGFDAVPALLDHLNDDRLIRATFWYCTRPGTVYYRVGDAARYLLRALADGTEPKPDARGEDAALKTWWAKARAVGEEKYLVGRAHDAIANGHGPNDVTLCALGARYPRRLDELYRELLDKGPGFPGDGSMAKAVARSELPREAKQKLLSRTAKHPDRRNRWGGLAYLHDIDPREADRLLIETLETVPDKLPGPDSASTEKSFARLAAKSTNPRVWAVLAKTVKRVEPGSRVEFLGEVAEGFDESLRARRLAFLADFLDDTAVRDITGDKKEHSGARAADEFPRLEVRNFAAMELAMLLSLETKPKENWTPVDWAKLRADVRVALAREGVR